MERRAKELPPIILIKICDVENDVCFPTKKQSLRIFALVDFFAKLSSTHLLEF